MYRTFVYTPRSGSKICKDIQSDNYLTVHTLRNGSHVVWSRLPRIELLREGRTLSRRESRHQLTAALTVMFPTSLTIDACGDVSVIPRNAAEYDGILAFCDAIGCSSRVAEEHSLAALSHGHGAFTRFHDGGRIIPAISPFVLSLEDKFPPHPEKEVEGEEEVMLDMNGCLVRVTPDGCRVNDNPVPPVEVRSAFKDYEEYED